MFLMTAIRKRLFTAHYVFAEIVGAVFELGELCESHFFVMVQENSGDTTADV